MKQFTLDPQLAYEFEKDHLEEIIKIMRTISNIDYSKIMLKEVVMMKGCVTHAIPIFEQNKNNTEIMNYEFRIKSIYDNFFKNLEKYIYENEGAEIRKLIEEKTKKVYKN